MACIGGLVVNRAARTDVTLSFLAFYLAIVFGRSLWLGEPIYIPLHRLQNGALLLFAFFMISDPKTTPDSRAGRVVFALLVALGAAFVQFKLFRTNGLLWSLALFSLATPILDRLLPGDRYQWKRTPAPNSQTHHLAKKGTAYEPISA
jgi:Na+-translocating ferredoxin:NAD+ oxidoreductase RnfD subunit